MICLFIFVVLIYKLSDSCLVVFTIAAIIINNNDYFRRRTRWKMSNGENSSHQMRDAVRYTKPSHNNEDIDTKNEPCKYMYMYVHVHAIVLITSVRYK